MGLPDVRTPTALLDEARLTRNLARMQTRIDRLGVRLRPHVKTSKCVEVARRQRDAGAKGITVSTMREAEEFFAAGFDDILYAVGITPQKLTAVQELRDRGCRMTVILDSLDAARAVVQGGGGSRVMIEVDTDGHRAGVGPESAELIDIGLTLHAGGASLVGVMTHAGSSYELDTPTALTALAEQERSRCVRAAERLRAAGLPCPEVSVGSTPTALSADSLAGVTEVRAGVYAFFDLVMVNVGVCGPDEIALSVLATVVGHQPEKGWAITDAGWMALSRDRGTQSQRVDYGYGAVCDAAGRMTEDFIVSNANQEHGIIAQRTGRATDIARHFPLGSQVRILPNHACATAAQFSHYTVIGADGNFTRWERFHGW